MNKSICLSNQTKYSYGCKAGTSTAAFFSETDSPIYQVGQRERDTKTPIYQVGQRQRQRGTETERDRYREREKKIDREKIDRKKEYRESPIATL